MYRSRGVGGFVTGLVMVLIGVGATIVSYMLASPGGVFFVFGGLIVGGCYRMVTALFYAPVLTPRPRKRPARGHTSGLPEVDYVAAPTSVPAGYCWQCGRQVKRGRGTCLACGAAQVTAAPKLQSAPTPAVTPWGSGQLPPAPQPSYPPEQTAWGQGQVAPTGGMTQPGAPAAHPSRGASSEQTWRQ